METFTLIAWIMVGQRFEEVQLPLLYAVQCTVFRDEMLRERSPVRAECVGSFAWNLGGGSRCGSVRTQVHTMMAIGAHRPRLTGGW